MKKIFSIFIIFNLFIGCSFIESKSFYETFINPNFDIEIELEQAIINSALFSELNYDYSSLELIGTSIVNEEKAYEIKITDNKTEYYSI